MAVINESQDFDFENDIPGADVYETPIEIDDENILTQNESSKRQKLETIEEVVEELPQHKLSVNIKNLRLPDPCPLPTNFSEATIKAIQTGKLIGNLKLRLTREAASFYYGICPNPTSAEYTTKARTLCDNYPQLKDKDPTTDYWVCSYV